MIQTAAIFRDAYRELNSRRLFWVSLVISGFIVLVYGALGINEKGVTILWWSLNFGPSTVVMRPEVYYKQLFVGLGIKFWLSWIACILALVSTAGMVPDLISSGSIELTLSKPIGRARLLLTKYAAGLLFVTLQVTLFTAASFVVMGVRGHAWAPGMFVAVPIVVILFSYLFSVCCLIGMVTRSTVAALLLTLLFWFLLFGINTSERLVLTYRTFNETRLEKIEQDTAARERRIEELEHPKDVGFIEAGKNAIVLADLKNMRERRAVQEGDVRSSIGSINTWYRAIYVAKTLLPKPDDTSDLLEHQLVALADLEGFDHLAKGGDVDINIDQAKDEVPVRPWEVKKKLMTALRERSVWWVMGTSLVFEAFVLGLTTWIFSRRDF